MKLKQILKVLSKNYKILGNIFILYDTDMVLKYLIFFEMFLKNWKLKKKVKIFKLISFQKNKNKILFSCIRPNPKSFPSILFL